MYYVLWVCLIEKETEEWVFLRVSLIESDHSFWPNQPFVCSPGHEPINIDYRLKTFQNHKNYYIVLYYTSRFRWNHILNHLLLFSQFAKSIEYEIGEIFDYSNILIYYLLDICWLFDIKMNSYKCFIFFSFLRNRKN